MTTHRIETESSCFDIHLVATEHHGLESDEVPILAENNAGEQIFLILKRDQIEEALIAHKRTIPATKRKNGHTCPNCGEHFGWTKHWQHHQKTCTAPISREKWDSGEAKAEKQLDAIFSPATPSTGYRTRECPICKQQVSSNGLAWTHHQKRHANKGESTPQRPPTFNEHDCGGVFDGNGVVSDADPGL